jgi:glycerophosphoryl diester phosphodiesterase
MKRLLLAASGLLGACTDGTTGGSSDAGTAAFPRLEPVVSACLTDRTCTTPMVVAHRGEGGDAPENTLAAILQGRENGADVVEIDVRTTLDGRLVLMHDPELTRTTNQTDVFLGVDAVSAHTLAEIRTLTIRDAEGRCTPQNADADAQRCRVPTLEEALDVAAGQVILMLDFKTADPTAVGTMVAARNATQRVIFFDGSEANLDAAAAAAPGLVTMPRAQDAATTADLVSRRQPFVVHVDPPYLAAAAATAHAAGVKVFVNLFAIVDFGLVAHEISGDTEALGQAETAMTQVLNDGADLMQTDRSPQVRALVDAWRRTR